MAEPIAVITMVGKERFGWWQGIEDQPRPLVVAHLPFAQQQDEGLATQKFFGQAYQRPSRSDLFSGTFLAFCADNGSLCSLI